MLRCVNLKYVIKSLTVLILLFCTTVIAQSNNPFKINYNESGLKLNSNSETLVEVDVEIPPGHYLYAAKTKLTWQKLEGLELGAIKYPPSSPHLDAFTGKTEQVYLESFTISSPMKALSNFKAEKIQGELKFQGCSDELCLLPQKVSINISLLKDQAVSVKNNQTNSGKFWNFIHAISPDNLLSDQSGNVGFLYFIAFLGGLITCFTPCVFPIIPLTMSFIGAHAHKPGSFKRELMLVAGMVSMYCLLGLVAAWLGLGAGFLFKSKYFILFLALMFFIFALGMFEVVPFELPASLRNKLSHLGGGSTWGAGVVGLSLGFIASPCVGPLVGPFLILAAQKQSQWFGASLLASYGLGMGLFFLILAHAYRRFKAKISGRFFRSLKIILGVALLLPAIYYAWVFFNIINPHVSKNDAAYWQHDYVQALNLAKSQNKPILIDFYADWCPPCVEMEHKTYASPSITKIAEQFIMMKVDCTVFNDQCDDLSAKYNVVGMPTMIFLNAGGEMIQSIPPVNGYKTVDQLMLLMQNALTQK